MEASPLYLDLTKRTLSESLAGGAYSLPALIQGDALTFGLRLTQSIGGSAVPVSRVVNSVRAVIGRLDARPEGGKHALTIGEDAASSANTTAPLAFNATAKQVQDAINALTAIVTLYGACTVEAHAGSYLIRFGTGAVQVEIAATSNSLFPVTLCRVRPYEANGEWTHELRLIQAPVALSDTYERVVPPAPTVTRLRAGGYNGTVEWNEIQKLNLPPAFEGAFQMRRGYRKTSLLSRADGPEEIAEALKALCNPENEESLSVTNPTDNAAHIEFTGGFAGTPQDLLLIDVFDAPEGDITFTIPLTSSELAVALRADAEIKLPLEIEAEMEDADDVGDARTVKLWRGDVTIRRELAYEELANAQHRDWLRGPKRKDYRPFNPSQVLVGELHFVDEFGDGTASIFVFDHDLDSDALHITVRENVSGGAFLVLGTDYNVTVDDSNQVTITMLTGNPWATDTLGIIITAAGPISAFAAHLHAIEDVTGLRAELDALGLRIEELEDLIPQGAAEVAAGVVSGPVAEWALPGIFEVFPSREAVTPVASLSELDRAKLPRASGLYPAVHDASTETLTVPVPPASPSFVGRVFANASGSTVTLPGGSGMRSGSLKNGEYAACDGRAWYKVVKYHDASQTTFYPHAYERELFMFHVDEMQLRLKKTFKLNFGIEVATLKSDTRCQWAIIVQVGIATQATTPATTGPNLAAITWVNPPLLEKRFIVTPVAATHKFGVNIKRALDDGDDTLTAEKVLYGNAYSAVPPASATFAIRALLARFDTEDGLSDPRGYVALRGLAVSTDAQGVALDGRAIIE